MPCMQYNKWLSIKDFTQFFTPPAPNTMFSYSYLIVLLLCNQPSLSDCSLNRILYRPFHTSSQKSDPLKRCHIPSNKLLVLDDFVTFYTNFSLYQFYSKMWTKVQQNLYASSTWQMCDPLVRDVVFGQPLTQLKMLTCFIVVSNINYQNKSLSRVCIPILYSPSRLPFMHSNAWDLLSYSTYITTVPYLSEVHTFLWYIIIS